MIKDYVVFNVLAIRNLFKYKAWSRKKLNFLTLGEIYEILGATLPKGKIKKANKRYYICAKRMFYLRNSVVFGNLVLNKHRARMFCKFGDVIVSDTDNYGYPCIKVDNIEKAYASLISKLYPTKHNEVTIITTGSTGKTTSKQFINTVVSDCGNTFCEEQNMNTIWFQGAFVQLMPPGTKYWVQEVDESEIPHLAYTSQMLHPDIAVITNVGISHMKNFEGREHLSDNIAEITNEMSKDALVIYNYDDELLRTRKWSTKTVSVSISSSAADCYSTNEVITNDGKTEFVVNFGGKSEKLIINTLGRHNIYNAMYAYIVGKELGQSTKMIAESIRKYKPSGLRQNFLRTKNDNLLYVDCFNAAPDSMKYALETLNSIKGYNHNVAIIGDMLELGIFENESHKKVGEIINSQDNIDTIICCGELARIVYEEISNKKTKYYCKTNAEAAMKLREITRDGEPFAILFKASARQDLINIIKTNYPDIYKTIKKSNKLVNHYI